MIAEYQSRFPSASHTAIVGNFLATPPSISSLSSPETTLNAEAIARDPLLNNFDAVIVGLGFHHFENWALAMRKLSERVKKGGIVGIIDLEPDLDVCSHDYIFLCPFLSVLTNPALQLTHSRNARNDA